MKAIICFTKARYHALEVVAECHPTPARESNITRAPGEPGQESLVYWQTARWLVSEGLVEQRGHGWAATLHLTPEGIEVCRREGIALGSGS